MRAIARDGRGYFGSRWDRLAQLSAGLPTPRQQLARAAQTLDHCAADLTQSEADARAKRRRNTILILVAIVALLLAGWATTPNFLTFENIMVVIRAASITGMLNNSSFTSATSSKRISVGGTFGMSSLSAKSRSS